MVLDATGCFLPLYIVAPILHVNTNSKFQDICHSDNWKLVLVILDMMGNFPQLDIVAPILGLVIGNHYYNFGSHCRMISWVSDLMSYLKKIYVYIDFRKPLERNLVIIHFENVHPKSPDLSQVGLKYRTIIQSISSHNEATLPTDILQRQNKLQWRSSVTV